MLSLVSLIEFISSLLFKYPSLDINLPSILELAFPFFFVFFFFFFCQSPYFHMKGQIIEFSFGGPITSKYVGSRVAGGQLGHP
jgi:hypothetical protein